MKRERGERAKKREERGHVPKTTKTLRQRRCCLVAALEDGITTPGDVGEDHALHGVEDDGRRGGGQVQHDRPAVAIEVEDDPPLGLVIRPAKMVSMLDLQDPPPPPPPAPASPSSPSSPGGCVPSDGLDVVDRPLPQLGVRAGIHQPQARHLHDKCTRPVAFSQPQLMMI